MVTDSKIMSIVKLLNLLLVNNYEEIAQDLMY